MQGGVHPKVSYEELKSKLNLALSENSQQKSKLALQEGELARLMAALGDFHQRLVKLDAFTKF